MTPARTWSSTWRGLGAHYEAPEAAQLFTVMDPVEAKARDFGDAVQQVAVVLTAYAERDPPDQGVAGRGQA